MGRFFFAWFRVTAISTGLEHYSNPAVVLHPGFAFRIMTTITLLTGSIFLMWVGEQMSERGIGNGISLFDLRRDRGAYSFGVSAAA